MVGKNVIPTIKYSVPTYYSKTEIDNKVKNAKESFESLSTKNYCYNDINGCNYATDYYYASSPDEFSLHGGNESFAYFLEAPINYLAASFNYIQPNDYGYSLNNEGVFKIYKFLNTDQRYDNEEKYKFEKGLCTNISFNYDAQTNEFDFFEKEGLLQTCQETALNGFAAIPEIYGNYQYDMRGTK